MPELRAEAVQQLGNMGAQEELAQLYGTEKTIEVRRRIIQAMFQKHNPDALVQLLKTETEPELRRVHRAEPRPDGIAAGHGRASVSVRI